MFNNYDSTYDYTNKALRLSVRQSDTLRTELYKMTFNRSKVDCNYNSFLWLRKLSYINKVTTLTFTTQYC